MNPSYVLLVALLVAATAAIYGTYLYMLDKAKDFHTEDVAAAAAKALLDLEPGQSKTAHVAIPHDTTLKICPDKECHCGAPTCIAVTGPTTATVIGTTAEVIIQPGNTTQTEYVLPAGTYIIKAHAELPDLEKITICRVAYQAVVDAQKLISAGCHAVVDEIIKRLSNITSAFPDISSWLDPSLLENLKQQAYALCEKGEDIPKFIYGYFCVKKKIYLEVTPT
jgi:hypothetical protein